MIKMQVNYMLTLEERYYISVSQHWLQSHGAKEITALYDGMAIEKSLYVRKCSLIKLRNKQIRTYEMMQTF